MIEDAVMDNVIDIISKYAKQITELPFSAGDHVKIIYRRDGRCYMTVNEADFSDITPEDVIDVTDHDQSQLLAASALMKSKTLSAMILCEPPYTGICIASHHEIPAVLDDMAQIVGPAVRMVAPEESQIAKALTKSTAVMIENGCLVAGGRNLFEALTAVEIIEKSAETILKAQVIGGVKPLGARLSAFMHRKYQKHYSKEEIEYQDEAEQQSKVVSRNGFDAAGYDGGLEVTAARDAGDESGLGSTGPADEEPRYDFDERELALREKLVEYGRKLLDTGLVQGTWGNLSVMLDRENMLCTPSGIDYDRLGPEDIVKVNIRTLKSEGIHNPTSEKEMHAGIYRTYPESNAVIHTHSKYCSIFAACEMPLQIESDDKMGRLGEIIGVSRYALAGTRGITRSAIKAIRETPGCILSHHGMIARGTSLEEAFENAGLIEEAAEEYINRRWEK